MAGIYIHIPFCKQACSYCNFHFSTSLKFKHDFIDALLIEINLQKKYLANETINTIYFGGGTPSLLTHDELLIILDEISKFHIINSNAEITLEANPDDLNLKKLNDFRKAGINRLSIGIQSFYDEDLKFMNRAHTSQQAITSIKETLEAGFNNFTIDLIYGTPTLSSDNWLNNLQIAFSFNIPHISTYCLTIEPKTALHHTLKKEFFTIDEEKSAHQFTLLMKQMQQQGYIHYEISNFAKDGLFSKHNTGYWQNEKYLGLGPSAHSYNGLSRRWNIANNIKYVNWLNRKKIIYEEEQLTTEQKFNEYVMTSLRTFWGCDIEKIKSEWSEKIFSTFMLNIEPYLNENLIVKTENKLRLTNDGKLFADKISSDLFIT